MERAVMTPVDMLIIIAVLLFLILLCLLPRGAWRAIGWVILIAILMAISAGDDKPTPPQASKANVI
jgi:hypothetical protein